MTTLDRVVLGSTWALSLSTFIVALQIRNRK